MVVIAFIFFIAIVFSILRGLTLDVFWDWFITGPNAPFHSVPSITFVQALGLSLVVTFLTFQPGAEKSTEGQSPVEAAVQTIGVGIFWYATVWAFAIAYHALGS